MKASIAAYRRWYKKNICILQTLKLGVIDAVICFIERSMGKANAPERVKIRPSKLMI